MMGEVIINHFTFTIFDFINPTLQQSETVSTIMLDREMNKIKKRIYFQTLSHSSSPLDMEFCTEKAVFWNTLVYIVNTKCNAYGSKSYY